MGQFSGSVLAFVFAEAFVFFYLTLVKLIFYGRDFAKTLMLFQTVASFQPAPNLPTNQKALETQESPLSKVHRVSKLAPCSWSMHALHQLSQVKRSPELESLFPKYQGPLRFVTLPNSTNLGSSSKAWTLNSRMDRLINADPFTVVFVNLDTPARQKQLFSRGPVIVFGDYTKPVLPEEESLQFIHSDLGILFCLDEFRPRPWPISINSPLVITDDVASLKGRVRLQAQCLTQNASSCPIEPTLMSFLEALQVTTRFLSKSVFKFELP